MDRWAVIRRVAAETIRDFERRAKRPAFTREHGSHAVLEDLLDECFQLTVVDDPSLPPDIRGKLDLDHDTIHVNPALSGPRRVYTIAHDLGHRALEHPPRQVEEAEENINEEPYVGSLSVQDGVYRSYNPRDRWELEANVFGAELLAPVERVRAAVHSDPGWTVDGLAGYFGLSPTAMRNQLATALLPGPPGEVPLPARFPARRPDPAQEEAATIDAPALVIAGPGAGKTRVLVRRFVHLVEQGVEPSRILALTFSNKAAEEMRERLVAVLPRHAHAITVTTFHSFGLQLLQEYGPRIGLKEPLQLLTPTDAFVFLRGRLADLPVGRLEDLRRPARNLKLVLDLIGRAKEELAGPAELATAAAEWTRELGARAKKESEEEQAALEREHEDAADAAETAAIYAVYQAWLREAGYVDYGDLIIEAVRVLSLPEVAAEVRARYEQILVDEFQDINYASGRLVKALDDGRRIVWAVADPKQSIYRFRGASPANLRQFRDDYPGAPIKYLESNYRSVEDIVQCGRTVLIPSFVDDGSAVAQDGQDPMQVPVLTAERGRPSGEAAIEVITAPELKDELAALAGKIEQLHGSLTFSDISVLCRTRNQAQKVAEALQARGIPTNWNGSLEERPAFKDLMGVLYLAADDLRGLVRLARVPEHALARDDLRRLLAAGRARGRSAQAALHAACNGDVPDLSPEGREQAVRLKALAGVINHLPTAWRVLSHYLFEYARWPRALFADSAPEAQLQLATLGQVVNLTREFELRGALIGGRDTAHFLEYVQACLEAGELGATGDPMSRTDAVHVLTIHRSKGLEWPAVLVPQLAEGRYPPRDNRKKLRLPPALLRDPSVADENIEEACIFYVAVTRARDRLVLSRADKYPNGRAAPLRHLTHLLGELEGTGYVRETVASVSPDEAPAGARAAEAGWPLGDEVTFRLLKNYEDCPRRFFYDTVLGLRNDDPGYAEFHDTVYATMAWIAEQVASGSRPLAEAVSGEFAARWEERGPKEHPYAAAYQRRGEQIAQEFARRLQPGTKVRLREEVRLGDGPRGVTVKIDEIEEGATPIFRRHYFGPPAKRHAKDEHLPFLFAAAHFQQNGQAPCEVRNYYPLHDRDDVVPINPSVITRRKKKMEDLAAGIEAGQFSPKPEEMRCASCPYYFICPLDGPD